MKDFQTNEWKKFRSTLTELGIHLEESSEFLFRVICNLYLTENLTKKDFSQALTSALKDHVREKETKRLHIKQNVEKV